MAKAVKFKPDKKVIITREDDDPLTVDGMVGHNGKTDYFVFDMAASPASRVGGAILGFEHGRDLLVFVNATKTDVDSAITDAPSAREIVHTGLPNTNLPDGHAVSKFRLDPPNFNDGIYYGNIHVFTIDRPLQDSDIRTFGSDPFLV